MFFYLTSAPTTPAVTLHHAFGGPNHDDSVHVDGSTTNPTPTDLFHNMLRASLINISYGLARYIVSNISGSTKMSNMVHPLL